MSDRTETSPHPIELRRNCMHRLASIRRRLACAVYECIVSLAILLLAGLAFHAVVRTTVAYEQARIYFQAYLVFTIGIYYCWHWTRIGQTLPMKTWRLRLVTDSGKLIGRSHALARYCLAWISLLSFGLGFLWAFIDTDGQFLHDRILHTRIVYSDDA